MSLFFCYFLASFYRVLPIFTELHRVLLIINEIYRVLPSFTEL